MTRSERTWKRADQHPMPHGESVLCWDAVCKCMFVGYASGDDVVPEPPAKGTTTPYTSVAREQIAAHGKSVEVYGSAPECQDWQIDCIEPV